METIRSRTGGQESRLTAPRIGPSLPAGNQHPANGCTCAPARRTGLFGPGVMRCLVHSLLACSCNVLSTVGRVRRENRGGEDVRDTVKPGGGPASSKISETSRCLIPVAADALTFQPPESTLLLAVSPYKEDLAFLTQTFRETTWKLCEAHTYRETLTILCHDRMPVVICRWCLPDGSWKDVLSQTAYYLTLRGFLWLPRSRMVGSGQKYSISVGTMS
jgi:hypothetical protein